ncbi:MAG: hypothetical protein RL757_3339, partial [Bacteroidota bacterium]
MEIRGEIKKIVYSAQLSDLSKVIEFATFDVNKMPSSCILHIENSSFAISKWVSPKRTRSYPYERVYNTLSFSKKITIIPIIKDEGAAGDRDFLQWDTISLMSLLDVYVIPAFYTSAQARGAKITNQCFDTKFIADKIYEIKNFHSSALHWNLNELKENFGNLLDKVIQNYQKIEIETGIKLHNSDGIKRFQQKIEGDVANFMQFSREKAKSAQQRELETIQPKENLSSATKSKITITNFLGGQYFFTVDEIVFENQKLSLIEAKHSKNGW